MSNPGNFEIIQIVDAVARERGIPKADLINAMEQAYQIAGRKKYGAEHNIKAEIDQNTGDIKLFRVMDIVENPEDSFTEIALDHARETKPDAELGEQILDPLPPIELGRVVAGIAKQVIVQKVSEFEKKRQYDEFKSRAGEVINGIVKRVEFGNIIVDLGRAEGLMRRDQQIRGEIFKVGDRIKSLVRDVKEDAKGHQIFLSRTDPQFLVKLFEIEVPEIYDNIIEVRSVAREPGSKAKIAVFASDVGVDPVGSCVGVRGARVRAITNELSGEKIDIIVWDKNMAQFIINAMTPAEISKIVFDEEKGRVEAIVPEDQLSMAVGKGGQNVRLASKITGWTIDVLTDDQESARRSEEFANNTELFMKELEVEEIVAQLLCSEGYGSIYQVATAEDSALLSIEGFEEELVAELKNRAINIIDSQNEAIIDKLESLGAQQELIDLLEIPPEYILKLAEYGVKTIEDLGEITVHEFRKIVPNNVMSKDEMQQLIEFAKNQEE